MVMTHHQFRCEICGEAYNSQEAAAECEKRGQPQFVFPRGLVFQSINLDPDVWHAVVFVVKTDTIIGHQHALECWRIAPGEKPLKDYGPKEWDEIAENNLKVFNFDSILISIHGSIHGNFKGSSFEHYNKAAQDQATEMLAAAVEFCKYRGIEYSQNILDTVYTPENEVFDGTTYLRVK